MRAAIGTIERHVARLCHAHVVSAAGDLGGWMRYAVFTRGTGLGCLRLACTRCYSKYAYPSTRCRPVVLPICSGVFSLIVSVYKNTGTSVAVSLSPCSPRFDAFWFVLLMEDLSISCLCLYVVYVGCVPCGFLFPAVALFYQAFASLLLMVKIEPSMPYSDFGPPIPYLK